VAHAVLEALEWRALPGECPSSTDPRRDPADELLAVLLLARRSWATRRISSVVGARQGA